MSLVSMVSIVSSAVSSYIFSICHSNAVQIYISACRVSPDGWYLSRYVKHNMFKNKLIIFFFFYFHVSVNGEVNSNNFYFVILMTKILLRDLI